MNCKSVEVQDKFGQETTKNTWVRRCGENTPPRLGQRTSALSETAPAAEKPPCVGSRFATNLPHWARTGTTGSAGKWHKNPRLKDRPSKEQCVSALLGGSGRTMTSSRPPAWCPADWAWASAWRARSGILRNLIRSRESPSSRVDCCFAESNSLLVSWAWVSACWWFKDQKGEVSLCNKKQTRK